METPILFFIFFIAIELFETNWQKSDTLYGLIENNYKIFSKNIFLYFILHLSFFYALYLSFTLNNFSFFMSFIIVLKFLDISFKLIIMKKLSKGETIENIIPIDFIITPIFKYLNVLIYPVSFLIATL